MNTHTWANGFGNWHATPSPGLTSHQAWRDALTAIESELSLRGECPPGYVLREVHPCNAYLDTWCEDPQHDGRPKYHGAPRCPDCGSPTGWNGHAYSRCATTH